MIRSFADKRTANIFNGVREGSFPATLVRRARSKKMINVPTNRVAMHPGVLLLEQIRDMGLTVNGVARDIGLPATRLHEIIHERRGVRAETAIALGVYFGQTPDFWMNAQKAYELSKELVENGVKIHSRIRRHAKDRVAR